MKDPRLRDGLRSARISNGLSQKAVADQLGIPRTAITQIENGNRKLSTLELTKLARLYRCSVNELLDDTNPSDSEDVVNALQPFIPELQEDFELQDQITKYLELCREGKRLRDLVRQRSHSGPPDYDVSGPRSFTEAVEQAEIAADQERRRTGLEYAPISDLVGFITEQDIWVAGVELPNETSGFSINHRDIGRAVFVNSQYPPSRRRFSFAHEYAHALLDRDKEVCVSSTCNSDTLIERRANEFAACFLLPEQGVANTLTRLNKGIPTRQAQAVFDVAAGFHVDHQIRSAAGSQRVDYKDVSILAQRFGVSYQTALYRLKNLHHIRGSESSKLLSQEDIGHEFLSELGMRDDLEESKSRETNDLSLRREIASLAIEAYRREEISRGRILELATDLGMSGETLLRLADAARDA